MTNLEKARGNFLLNENYLSKYATKSSDAIRLIGFEEDIRPSFFHDIDRIIHSLSYTRYADKTQVYSFRENDHISKRIIHVQLVSKIARTIGRALKLNCDLIEAIALGHDIGHTPIGHTGEALLNEISISELNENFMHNIQGVRYYMEVENNGYGLDLCIQTLDGIMCHNGEMLSNKYIPMEKDKDEVLREYYESYKDKNSFSKYSPMTLEGCVVRISDIIGYIGRDIEDAINLGLFKRCDLPEDIVQVLGNNNKDIVNTIILDIIENSMDKDYIMMSNDVYKALFDLKRFNYENIYNKSLTKEEIDYYRIGMRRIYDVYLDEVENNNKNSLIYKIFLSKQNDRYINNTNNKRKVIDFIAGMTDDLFLHEIEKYCKNK